VVIAIIATGAYYYGFRAHDPHVRATCRLRDAAGQIDAILKPGTRVEYVGTDYTLQFYLNTVRPLSTAGEAVRLMALPVPIIIIMSSTYQEAIKMSLAEMPVYLLFQSEDIVVFSNRPPSQT